MNTASDYYNALKREGYVPKKNEWRKNKDIFYWKRKYSKVSKTAKIVEYSVPKKNKGQDFSAFHLKFVMRDKKVSGPRRIVIISEYEPGKKGFMYDQTFDIPKDLTSSWFDRNMHASFLEKGYQDTTDTVFVPGDKILFIPLSIVLSNQEIFQKFAEPVKYENCMCDPAINYFAEKIETVKTNKTKQSYRQKQAIFAAYKRRYPDGIPQNVVSQLALDTRCSIVIKDMFGKDHFQHLVKSARHKLIYTNSRINHVEFGGLLFESEPILKPNLTDILDQVKADKAPYTRYQNARGETVFLATMGGAYKKTSAQQEVLDKFESELTQPYIDSKINQSLTNYLRSSVRIAGVVDYKAAHGYIRHIDMVKSYAQFDKNDYYVGFPTRFTDFRKITTQDLEKLTLGVYTVESINFTNCTANTKKHFNSLQLTDGTYTLPFLKFLKDNGAQFTVLYGAWGVKTFKFSFPEYMLEKNDKGVGYYSIWSGLQSHFPEYTTTYMPCNDAETSKLIKSRTDHTVYFDKNDGELMVRKPKRFHKHRAHLLSFIAQYSQIYILQQLLKINHEDVFRVQADGLYIKRNAKFELMGLFRDKESSYDHSSYYFSTPFLCKTFHTAKPGEPLDNHQVSMIRGAGGTGKTHSVLTDKGYTDVTYVATSWLLTRSKSKDYKRKGAVVAQIVSDNSRSSIKSEHPSVLLIDEATQLSAKDMQSIVNEFPTSKIIFAGDFSSKMVPYQTPCINGELPEPKMFGHISKMSKNYRVQCGKLKQLLSKVRKGIRAEYDRLEMNKLVYSNVSQKINRSDVSKLFEDGDLILAGRNTCAICKLHECTHDIETSKNLVDYYNKLIAPKFTEKTWMHIKSTEQYSNGQIVKSPIRPADARLAYAATVHKVQGMTVKSPQRLFIDMTNHWQTQITYTALSRVQKLDQIYLIYPDNIKKRVRVPIAREPEITRDVQDFFDTL